MEELAPKAPTSLATRDEPPAAWRDLREWIALCEQRGQIHCVGAEVDPHEELSGITYMRTRDEKAPALFFERLPKNPHGARGPGLRVRGARQHEQCGKAEQ